MGALICCFFIHICACVASIARATQSATNIYAHLANSSCSNSPQQAAAGEVVARLRTPTWHTVDAPPRFHDSKGLVRTCAPVAVL
jgi:hypothetical protein